EVDVGTEAGAAACPPEHETRPARSEDARKDVVRLERLDARAADAEARLDAAPRPGTRPRGLDESSFALLVEGGPRREALVARFLDRREDLGRQGDRKPAIRRGDRAAARADGVAGRPHREAMHSPESVGRVGAELDRVARRTEREVEKRPDDEGPPGRVRSRGRERLRGECRRLRNRTRILRRCALLRRLAPRRRREIEAPYRNAARFEV